MNFFINVKTFFSFEKFQFFITPMNSIILRYHSLSPLPQQFPIISSKSQRYVPKELSHNCSGRKTL